MVTPGALIHGEARPLASEKTMERKDRTRESKVEPIKRESRHLRGTIAESLAADSTHFSPDETQLLKFHGIYQQDDRDVRRALRGDGKEEAYQMMVRCLVPAGRLTSDQYLELDRIAEEYADGSIRITTRQGIQFHGVLKQNIKAHIRRVNEALLTTLSACGDVERNVMACCAPIDDEPHRLIREAAGEIARQLRPASHAYHEIWLDEACVVSTAEEEPFYSEQYLPRKFKSGIALADDNCVDVYTQDFGLIAIVGTDRLLGFNVVVGGGLGMTHNKPDTRACLAEPLGFIDPEHAVEAARTTAAIFRDHGNRADRRHTRLKYLLAERGIDWFRAEFERRALFALEPRRELPRAVAHDHLGAHAQRDGRFFYGVYVPSGRVRYGGRNGSCDMRTAIREIARRLRPGITLTPHQNILFTDLAEAALDELTSILDVHGAASVESDRARRLTQVRRYAMACPALPTCGLALAESERVAPDLLGGLERVLSELGLSEEPIGVRMTGCPNGCSRPYTADIGIVGRRPGVYHLYVGGGLGGDRLADLYAADVPIDEVVSVLEPLLAHWSCDRSSGESLSDFYHRVLRRGEPRRSITGRETPTSTLIPLGSRN